MDGQRPDFLALGPLAVRRGGRDLDLGSPKQRALLGLLLHHAPHPVPVDRVVDELWGVGPPGDPGRSVQVYVSGLRRALGPDARLVERVGHAYRLAVGPDGCDVARFERAVVAAAAAAARGDHEEAVRIADPALAGWRGEAWHGLRHLPVLGDDAHRLDGLRLDLLTTRAAARLASGDHREVLADLEVLVDAHPLREDLRELLVLALHRSGRRQEALACYAEGRRWIVEETGLDPGPGLVALQRRVLADDPSLMVEDAGLRRRRHLPAPTTPLVGRVQDVADLVDLLRGGARLVTVRGPGGVGKTRVALRTAHELADAFSEGVWFVDLAAVIDPALVPQAVAEALHLEDLAPDPARALERHLAARRVLLVLDNMEQLLEAVPVVARLVAAGPGVAVLATSRVPLRAYGEHVRTLDVLGAHDAVTLFEDRARRADHRVDLGSTGVVRRICDSLDRLPLALELVAARVGDLSLEEVMEQLEHRLDLAGEGPRDRSPRQRSLRGAIGWSVGLLPVGAREAFARLSVFRGGADDEAARAVGVDDTALAEVVAAGLASRGAGRVTMLETVREAAAELLGPGGTETHLLQEAHAVHFRGLASSAAEGLRGPGAPEWTRLLDIERGNLRAALSHLLATAPTDGPVGTRVLGMAADLSLYWYRTAPTGEDVGWLDRALGAAPTAEPLLRARAWHGLAICRGEQGRSVEALAASGHATDLFREGGDDAWLARSLNTWGGLHRDLGHPEEATTALEESLALRTRLGDPTLSTTLTRANLALVALDVGDTDAARRYLEANLHDVALTQDAEDVAATRALLADAAVDEGDVDGAREHLRLALGVLRPQEREFRLAECLDTLAGLAALLGRSREAAVLVAAADAALARDGGTQVPADALLRERRVGPALASLAPADLARARAEGAATPLLDAVDRAAALLLDPRPPRRP